MLKRSLLGLTFAGAILSGALAQDLPKSHFKVIGLNGPTPASIHDEVPFWRKTDHRRRRRARSRPTSRRSIR